MLEVEVPEATASVEFSQDGPTLIRRNRPPWTVSIALGEIVLGFLRKGSADLIGKTLDAGAHGIIVPMVNTRSQAEAVVDAARYAPASSSHSRAIARSSIRSGIPGTVAGRSSQGGQNG